MQLLRPFSLHEFYLRSNEGRGLIPNPCQVCPLQTTRQRLRL